MESIQLKLLNIEYNYPQNQDSYTLEWGILLFENYQLNIQAVEPPKSPLSLSVPISGTHERFALKRAVYLANLYYGANEPESLCFRVDNGVIIVIEDDNGYNENYLNNCVVYHNYVGAELVDIKAKSENGCINIDIPTAMRGNNNIIHYLIAYQLANGKWVIQRLPRANQKRNGLKLYYQYYPSDIHAAYDVNQISRLHLLGMNSSWIIPTNLQVEPRSDQTPSSLRNDPKQTSV